MKLRTFLITTLSLIILIANSLSVNAETVRGFLVDLKIVDILLERGAVDIKVYAAHDKEYKPYYIMAGLDAQGALISGQVYRQNETGDCPPTCEFLPTKLTNGGAFIEQSEAEGLIKNYLEHHSAAQNSVQVCAYSLNKVKEKGYQFMRISFDDNVKITGVTDNGRVKWFAPFSHSCNSLTRSSLTTSSSEEK